MKKLCMIASLLFSLLPITVRAEFIEITSEEDFNNAIANNEKVVVKFHATWCPACKKSAHPFEEAAKTHNDVTFVSVDVDKFPEPSNQHGITGLPTFVYFRNGQKIDEEVGGKSHPDQVHQAVNEKFSDVNSSVDAYDAQAHKDAAAPQHHAEEAGILAKLKALVVWIFTKIKDFFVGVVDTIKGFFGR